MEVRADVVVLGAIDGLAYGLVAVGLVLAFRASRVLNLAHGQIGAFGAVVLGVLVLRWDAPYWLALPVALGAGAAVGAALELTVVRRLERAPPLMTLVATLGAAQVLQQVSASLAGRDVATAVFPHPPGLPSVEVGALLLTPAYVAMVLLAPATVAAMGYVWRRTGIGLALRGAADAPDAARALGIPARRYATAAWAVAGALATLTAVLVLPAGGVVTIDALGPELLLRALAAGVLAGMASLPGALAAGVGIGVVEQVVRWNSTVPGVPDAVLLALIAAGLVCRRPQQLRRVDASAWSAFEPWDRLPAAARAVPLVRWAGPALAVTASALAAVPVVVAAPEDLLTLTTVACYALVGVSVWIVTGLGGELSLGQFALAGVGCAAAAGVERELGNPGLGLVAAAVVAAALGVVLAIPTLRAGGLALTVLTLAGAIAAERWLLEREWTLGEGVQLGTLRLGPIDSSTAAGAYALSLVVLVVVVAWASALGRSPFGRRLRAVRDNAPVARALGIDPDAHRLQAMGLAGGVAGVAGALFGHALTVVSSLAFPVQASVDVAVMALLGGLAIAAGPVLGAAWIVALPAFVALSGTTLAATATGWLVLLLYVPGGLAAVLDPIRRAGAGLLLRLAGQDPGLARAPAAAPTGADPAAAALARAATGPPPDVAAPEPGAPPVLRLDGIRRDFGAVRALDGVTVEVGSGRIVTVIGPNGAGKTTLLDVACGFERPHEGRVLLDGEDVTGLPAQRLAARGIGRSFQEVDLFPTLTVAELVRTGAERAGRRDAAARSGAVLDDLGLAGYAGFRIRALSTGTRRLAELACLLAAQPRILVLDEPSAGLAQPEARALAALLRRLRDRTGVALLVVEHDIPLVGAVADHVVVLASGRVAAEGPPHEVLDGAGAPPGVAAATGAS